MRGGGHLWSERRTGPKSCGKEDGAKADLTYGETLSLGK